MPHTLIARPCDRDRDILAIVRNTTAEMAIVAPVIGTSKYRRCYAMTNVAATEPNTFRIPRIPDSEPMTTILLTLRANPFGHSPIHCPPIRTAPMCNVPMQRSPERRADERDISARSRNRPTTEGSIPQAVSSRPATVAPRPPQVRSPRPDITTISDRQPTATRTIHQAMSTSRATPPAPSLPPQTHSPEPASTVGNEQPIAVGMIHQTASGRPSTPPALTLPPQTHSHGPDYTVSNEQPIAVGMIRRTMSGRAATLHALALPRHARSLGYRYAYTIRPPQDAEDPIEYALSIASDLAAAALVVYDLSAVDDQPARVCESLDLETVCPPTTWARVAAPSLRCPNFPVPEGNRP